MSQPTLTTADLKRVGVFNDSYVDEDRDEIEYFKTIEITVDGPKGWELRIFESANYGLLGNTLFADGDGALWNPMAEEGENDEVRDPRRQAARLRRVRAA